MRTNPPRSSIAAPLALVFYSACAKDTHSSWPEDQGQPPVAQQSTVVQQSAVVPTNRYETCVEKALPTTWSNLEIESKWATDTATFERLLEELPDRSNFALGGVEYEVRVRWSGISRRFTDIYYDTADRRLAKAGHVLRHRTRAHSEPLATNDRLETLKSATWSDDWQRIQYKSDATRLGPVWLREERGDCRIWDTDDDPLCGERPWAAEAVVHGKHPTHEAITRLLEDHDQLDLAKLTPSIEVLDFRYRVEFRDETGEAILELSADRLATTDLRGGPTTEELEVELEIVRSDYTREDLEGLFRASAQLECAYMLTASTTSKGGTPVPDTCLTIKE